jgi:hypothetical protein
MNMHAIQRIFGWSANKPEKVSMGDFYRSLYPDSVRYALRYNGAQLGKSELASLVDRYSHEVVYLVTKALAPDQEKQRQYLEDLTRLFVQPDHHLDDLRQLLYERIEQLPEEVTITGTKLAQVSRIGPDQWQRTFRNLIERCYNEDSNALPCIVAHTPLIAYHHFVDVYNRSPLSKLILLVPEWMMNPDNEQMGYEITLGDDPSVHIQTKHECLVGSWICLKADCRLQHRFCKTAIFIDDTINTGATSHKLTSFWKSEYGLQIPDSRIRVMTDLKQ